MPDLPVEDFARRLALLPGVVVDITPEAVRTAAEVLEPVARENVARAAGGDSKLSRVRSGRGAVVGVELRVRGAGSRAQAVVVPKGPVLLIEDDTKAHTEPFQYSANYSMGRRRKASRRGFLFIPGVGFRARARHPGTQGKRPIQKAFETHADDAGEAGLDVFTDAISKHLGRG